MADETGARSIADAMSADDYRRALEALRLSQGGGAELLGVDARTSRRWANNEREVPPPVARFLRYLIATKISPEEVLTALAADPLDPRGKP